MEARPQPTVLICPLDWGLGHASRCVPIIKGLLSRDCKVVVAADGAPMAFLQREFSQLCFLRFRAKAIRYPDRGSMALKMLFQTPSLLWSIGKEHLELKRLVRETGASLVISDNRYGLWSNHAKTVLLTHQLFIRAPQGFKLLEPLLWRITRFFVGKYNHCWVPDIFENPGLSGELSHKKAMPDVRFVGLLSRFSGLSGSAFKNPLPGNFPDRFFLVIISGPEPQRSRFEELLRAQFKKSARPVVFVLGKPGNDFLQREGNILLLNHADTAEFAWLFQNACMVISRPGYSTLMDLSEFGKKALLVPTPGQTEQEYLGEMLTQSGQAYCVKQKDLELERDLALAENHIGIATVENNGSSLNQALDDLLKEL